MNQTDRTLSYYPAPDNTLFCSQCGQKVEYAIPEGDTKSRAICHHCGAIHYRNPRIVVGTIPVYQGKILLCKRAIEPRYGYWTLPAGFMELNETTQQGAQRETHEESGAHVDIERLFSVVNVPQANQVHLFYLAHVKHIDESYGPETLACQFVDPADIPWNELAFKSVSETLMIYIKQTSTHKHIHEMDIFFP